MTVTALTGGLATYLAFRGHGIYLPGGIYQAGDRAICHKRLPPAPDTALAINVYDLLDVGTFSQPGTQLALVQLRFRAEVGGKVDDWADEIYQDLNYAHQFKAGTIHVARAKRVNFTALGEDSNEREQRTDNYELILS